jgi:primosomal protein N' (replication factor Y)
MSAAPPGEGTRSAAPAVPHARVAVPVPLPETLTYRVPEDLDGRVRPGVRVRVPVGRRKLSGVVLARTADTPPGIELRPVLEVVDREPVLTDELLALAEFVAGYYLAPPGEVVRAFLPAHLEPFGERKVWLTSAGALARSRSPLEEQVQAVLTTGGRLSMSELEAAVPAAELPAVIDRLLDEGRLATGRRGTASSVHYRAAVAVAGGDREALLAACGRSAPAREVVSWLAALGRPARIEEVTATVGCSEAVIRRLVKKGVLHRFTQVERRSLERHRLRAEGREAPPLVLRGDQQAAVMALTSALAAGSFAPFLLAGITGSGKTEVYLRAADQALAAGRGVIVLVPEIALVPALARTLEQRYGRELAILHSGLSAGERGQEWERIRRGEARVVLGPRSAVLAPVARLGLLVVDEEHDPAYKQDASPRYHGRDVALMRAREAAAVVVLASATPSLESRHNVARGKLVELRLTARAGRGGLPEGLLVDLRREGPLRRGGEVRFSAPLLAELTAALEDGGQAILLRNRRGYAPLLLCRACGFDHRCDGCGLPRTLHRRDGVLVCHYCGDRQAAPARCGECGEAALEALGAGTERIEEQILELFPGVPVGVLDRDVVQRPGGAAAVLERFSRGETRILVGTQMVSKGHHFPQVALAAVLAADTYLGFPDFRAVERTYNLLVQLAGRAGRGDRPGKVVVQSYHPEHYAIQAVLSGDEGAFVEPELRFRRTFHYPPYTRMIQLLLQGRARARVEQAAAELARRIGDHPARGELRLTGPAPAPFERLRGRYRFQLLLRAPSGRLLREVVRQAVAIPVKTDLGIDVDPQELL